jgi:5'-methylthioadenosine phosphorylase
MGRLALAGGSSFLGTGGPPPLEAEAERVEVSTEYGPVALLEAGDFVYLQRHGLDGYTPPHLIEHRANVTALRELGCDRVLAISSVGSLHREIGVGTFVCPDDFIALGLTTSAFDDERGHRVPGFDPAWRRRALDAWTERDGGPLRDGGVYWQTTGPRFETRAEIGLISAHASVVGMTVAAECVVAGELGLPYAVICAVDNLANGVAPGPLTIEELSQARDANRERLAATLQRVLPKLREAVA